MSFLLSQTRNRTEQQSSFYLGATKRITAMRMSTVVAPLLQRAGTHT